MRVLSATNIARGLGGASFGAGLLLAIVTGWFSPHAGWLSAVLVVLGVAVGLLNITGREVMPFLIATMALVVIGQGNIFEPLNDFVAGLGTTLDSVVDKIALFAAPAGLVNAVRAAIALARPGPSI